MRPVGLALGELAEVVLLPASAASASIGSLLAKLPDPAGVRGARHGHLGQDRRGRRERQPHWRGSVFFIAFAVGDSWHSGPTDPYDRALWLPDQWIKTHQESYKWAAIVAEVSALPTILGIRANHRIRADGEEPGCQIE
jgi:hypothetical protein